MYSSTPFCENLRDSPGFSKTLWEYPRNPVSLSHIWQQKSPRVNMYRLPSWMNRHQVWYNYLIDAKITAIIDWSCWQRPLPGTGGQCGHREGNEICPEGREWVGGVDRHGGFQPAFFCFWDIMLILAWEGCQSVRKAGKILENLLFSWFW